MIIIAGLGALIIIYSLFRHLTGIGLGEEEEKLMMNIVVFAALGIFIYNRKMAKDENQAKEARKKEQISFEELAANESLPHWERKENNDESK